jgi:hypothetical protein
MALGFQNVVRTTKSGKVKSVDYYAPRYIRLAFTKPTKRNNDQKAGFWALYDDREGQCPVTVLLPRQAAEIIKRVDANVRTTARIEEVSGPWRESYGQSALDHATYHQALIPKSSERTQMFQIAGIKLTQQQQMKVARMCDSHNQLLHLHLTDDVKNAIARVIRIVLTQNEVGLSNRIKAAQKLVEQGLTGAAIPDFQFCNPLRKFCR